MWCARALLGNEPFAVMLPDDLVLAPRACLAQMIEAWRKTGGNLAAVEEADGASGHTRTLAALLGACIASGQ